MTRDPAEEYGMRHCTCPRCHRGFWVDGEIDGCPHCGYGAREDERDEEEMPGEH